MDDCNYKVVAVLRADLPEAESLRVRGEVAELMKRLRIVSIGGDAFCKEPPIRDCDDFGAVAFFFAALKDMRSSFSRLEYYDLRDGRCRKVV